MENFHKQNIVDLVHQEAARLGKGGKPSLSAVARKVGVAPATITEQVAKSNWHLVSEEMWARIADSLGYELKGKWNLAETNNSQLITGVCRDAQEQSLFIAIADKAGAGKTASLKRYYRANQQDVFYVSCKEWSAKAFVARLAQELALVLPAGRDGKCKLTTVEMLDRVIEAFKGRTAKCNPLLILDEADKLKAGALRCLIPFYNELIEAGECGVVISGTKALEDTIKRSASRNVKGFDELDSRLGRQYIKLFGATFSDVYAICLANGLTNSPAIDAIWLRLQRTGKVFAGKREEVVEDLRRMQRLIEVERLRVNEKPN